jgi:hypothetical protein
LNGGRALTSVLSKQPSVLKAITDKYGSEFKVVGDYYERYNEIVNVIDVSPYIGRSKKTL